MTAGRPQKADPGTLYAFAHQFYWDLKQISEGYFRSRVDQEEYKRLAEPIDRQNIQLSNEQNIAIARVIVREISKGRIPEAEKESRLKSAAEGNREATRMLLYEEAAEVARKQMKVAGK